MPLWSWSHPTQIQRTWTFSVENSLIVNASVISTIRRPSFAKLITITFILTLNIAIPTIGWISEETVRVFFLLCLFLFALYVFFCLLFCHDLVVRVLRKRIMLRFVLFVPALLYAMLITMFLFLRLFWQRSHHHCLMIPYDATLLITPYGLILTSLLYNIVSLLATYKRAHVVDN